jgi:hypothetical protein
VTDDLTRRLAEQILRGIKELHEEQNPSEPLVRGTSVAPHAAAERIGISPVGHWYAEALEYLEEERVLERNVRPSDVVGDPQYILGARGPELMGGAKGNVPALGGT